MKPEEAYQGVIDSDAFRTKLKQSIKSELTARRLKQTELAKKYGEIKNKDGKPFDTGYINKIVNVWGGYEKPAAELYEYLCRLG